MTSFTHLAHTCRSLFLGAFSPTRGDQDRSSHCDHLSGIAATATAHVRVYHRAYDITRPLSVLNACGSRTREPLHDTRSHTASTAARGCPVRKIAPQPRRWAASRRPRSRLRPLKRASTCRRAGHAAGGRKATAATMCQQTCRMLESYAQVSL